MGRASRWNAQDSEAREQQRLGWSGSKVGVLKAEGRGVQPWREEKMGITNLGVAIYSGPRSTTVQGHSWALQTGSRPGYELFLHVLLYRLCFSTLRLSAGLFGQEGERDLHTCA